MVEKVATTAERLQTLVEKENLRQVEILERCKPYLEQFKIKMNRSDISQYIAGKAIPKQNKLYILARALNVSEAWLMGFDVPPERRTNADVENNIVSEIESIAENMSPAQLARLLEFAKMLKQYKGFDL